MPTSCFSRTAGAVQRRHDARLSRHATKQHRCREGCFKPAVSKLLPATLAAMPAVGAAASPKRLPRPSDPASVVVEEPPAPARAPRQFFPEMKVPPLTPDIEQALIPRTVSGSATPAPGWWWCRRDRSRWARRPMSPTASRAKTRSIVSGLQSRSQSAASPSRSMNETPASPTAAAAGSRASMRGFASFLMH